MSSSRWLVVLAWLWLAPAAATTLQPSDACPAAGLRYRADKPAPCFALRHGGVERTIRLVVPAGRTGALPLLLVLHGGGGNAAQMEAMTRRGLNRIAERDGVVVAYPDGVGKGWNDGRSDLRSKAVKEQVDDLGFLRALPRAIAAHTPIDLQRVYATGISNGGLMSFRLACDAADVYAAVAPVAANLSAELAPRCAPSRPVALAIVNGTDDPIMPWAGGPIKVLWSERGQVLSTPDTVARWRALGGCGPLETRERIDALPDDGTALEHRRAACRDGSELHLYEVRGGGHAWPGGEPYLGERLIGRVSRELDGNEAVWGFVRRFSH